MKRIHLPIVALCLLLGSAPFLQAGASNKKKDVFTVRIHGEGSPEEGSQFTVPLTLLDGRTASMSIMPLLTEHEIKSIYPFKAADGSGGVYLRLDGHGADLLTEYSIERMGRGNMLAVMVNGRQVIDLEIDKPVRDGVFVIPYGLTMEEEARLVQAYPIIGQENSRSQKMKKKASSSTNIMLPPKASDLNGDSAPAQ